MWYHRKNFIIIILACIICLDSFIPCFSLEEDKSPGYIRYSLNTIKRSRYGLQHNLLVRIGMLAQAYVLLFTLAHLLGKLPHVLHHQALRRISRKQILNELYRSLIRVRRNHRHMTDAGYGSRIGAASKMANAFVARHNLFGAYGPGRRKRPSEFGLSGDSIDQQEE